MRLIDANAFKQAMELEPDGWYKGGTVERHISEAPTIDAVPVVRCPMCKYCLVYEEQGGDGSYLGCTRPWGLRGALAPDEFCSYGERRGDGNG